MKKVRYFLFLVLILSFGCSEEKDYENQNLKDGEFVIKLYNSKGDLLLTRKGDAQNLAYTDSNWEIRLMDPLFGLPTSDPLKTFASLTVFGQSPITEPQELQFNNDNSAVLHQRWYSLGDDWGYKSTSGMLTISTIEKSGVKGSFEITLEVDADAQQNPLWGDNLLAKGYFSTIPM